ncbi:stromal membrane-associated protein 1 isoform X4 [Ictalurus punctatus]|uniref:Stromal membrane-associated protein 1 isoform X4 n=1 Tax=Ictalurus punctatus TaxID=7998 RepID=A0A979ESG1_ICTPU|nr:stromal membrane-associated protein 1 isoform X4 [Ictalurus punctatus]
MTTRSEREKAQKLNEQHQAILSKMLREDDNKYCADCEAKGPRWASWNLGVFICIRCAGIHRNLGVHISRVKSVNLDQWTPEQIQKEREKKKEEKKKEKETDKGNKPTVFDKKREDIQIDSRASPKKSAEPAIDLLGLDAPAVNTSSSGAGSGSAASISDDLDIFGPMVSNPLPSSTNTNQVNSTKAAGSTPAGPGVGATSGAVGTAGAAPVQSDLDLFSENSSNKAEESTKKPLSKDSILSLYGSSTVPQQPAPAAMFIGTSQMPFPAQPQANFQAFPAMGGPMPPTTMMGAVMGQGGAMMGQNTGMMVGMTMPNGFMGNAPAGVMGVAPGMMGAQAGAMPAGVVPPQNMYTMQPGQQTQWSVGQMNQQMSGLNLNGAPMAFGQPGTAMGGWVGPPSGQTLSTQLWK